jgi:nitroimidazol reductase NimA-like FMN-containing flavoprotein (pyridoxamine 5'-phosphate oxidase superfamily)
LYESVIVFGKADINLSDDEKRKALRKLVQKYSPNHVELGETYMEKSFHRTYTFRIRIEQMTGKCKK